jgi:hypothetical protein
VLLEPLHHLVGGVREQVAEDDMAAASRIAGVHLLEELDERVAVVPVREEAEQLAAADVVGAHHAAPSP